MRLFLQQLQQVAVEKVRRYCRFLSSSPTESRSAGLHASLRLARGPLEWVGVPPPSVHLEIGSTDNDIWYVYTATCTGTGTVSTCNDGAPETGEADFDTKVAAYEGCECPAGNESIIGCNDDGPGCTGFTSIMSFDAMEGTCYTIRVGGFGTSTGTGVLAVSCED